MWVCMNDSVREYLLRVTLTENSAYFQSIEAVCSELLNIIDVDAINKFHHYQFRVTKRGINYRSGDSSVVFEHPSESQDVIFLDIKI